MTVYEKARILWRIFIYSSEFLIKTPKRYIIKRVISLKFKFQPLYFVMAEFFLFLNLQKFHLFILSLSDVMDQEDASLPLLSGWFCCRHRQLVRMFVMDFNIFQGDWREVLVKFSLDLNVNLLRSKDRYVLGYFIVHYLNSVSSLSKHVFDGFTASNSCHHVKAGHIISKHVIDWLLAKLWYICICKTCQSQQFLQIISLLHNYFWQYADFVFWYRAVFCWCYCLFFYTTCKCIMQFYQWLSSFVEGLNLTLPPLILVTYGLCTNKTGFNQLTWSCR